MDIGRAARGVKSLSRHTLEQMVSLSSEGILLIDAQDSGLPIVYVNPAYVDLSGHSAEDLIGHAWPLAKRDDDNRPELAALKAAIGRAEPCRITVADLRKDGTSWQSSLQIEPIRNARGELKYFYCVQRPTAASAVTDEPAGADSQSVEVSMLQRELGRAREKIASLDRIDPVTGLLRFGYFHELLRRDLGIARRDQQRMVTVMVFEIIEFDAYRDTFGGKAAESCQRMIGAQIMRNLRRAGDLCARYDGTTLVAAVVGQSADEAGRLADQITSSVRRLGLHNPRAKSERYVTMRSAIVPCGAGTNDDVETLVLRARGELRTRTAGAAVATS
jgi:diguanylate cyclase (GGDEF)-like protein/PAS domain S-box-containing protein